MSYVEKSLEKLWNSMDLHGRSFEYSSSVYSRKQDLFVNNILGLV